MRTSLWLVSGLVLGLWGAGPLAAEQEPDPAKTLAKLVKARADAAGKTYEVMWKNYRDGRRYSEDALYRWSCRWLEAQRQLSDRKPDQVAAYKAHWERMRQLEKVTRDLAKAGAATVDELSAAEFYSIEAEIWFLQARG